VKVCIILSLLFVTLTAFGFEYTGPETELILLINEERKTNNAPLLILDWELARLARLRTEEMKTHKLFDHESLIYGSPVELLDRFRISYTLAGANIAKGQETPQDVLEAWQKSESHHSNIIDPNFTSAGVGLSWDDNGIAYWALLLITNQALP